MTLLCPTDEQLLRQIQAGDRSGLNQFHDRYRDLVFTVALRVCGQECDAEAVLVTVFWEIWKNPSNWNPERGSARTYLLLLTRSRARDLMRSEASRTTAHRKASEEIAFQQERHTIGSEPAESLADSDQSKQLREIAAALPPEMRECST